MFSTLLAIRTPIAANLLIFYIQKLPIIGKMIPNSIYSNLELEKAISIIALLLAWLWGFVLRFLYVGLMIYLPVAGIAGGEWTEEQRFGQFAHIFAIIGFAVASVSSATVLEPKREKYIAVKLMRVSPTRYMTTTLAYRYVTFAIYLLPAMLVFATLLGASILEASMLTLMVTLWRVMAEYGHLKLFERAGIVLIKKTGIVWTVILAGYAAAYAPLLLDMAPSTGDYVLRWPVFIVIAAGGWFAASRLARYGLYREAVDAATMRDDPLLNIGRMMADAQKKSVESKEGDYELRQDQKDRPKHKQGHAYLNVHFFRRHRSLISGPLNRRLAIVGALGAAGVILALMFRPQLQQLGWGLEMLLPYLVLTMYFMSVGESICRAMFYNCDLSLMRYGFYRGAAYIHFRIRLVQIAKRNLLIAAATGLSLTAVAFAAGAADLNAELLMLWLCVIALSLFYSVHHLFMYYMFQPYSTELNIKNPLYIAVNMGVSFASGLSIVWRGPAVPFTIIIVGLTVLYLAAALVLVRKHGTRTFRVK